MNTNPFTGLPIKPRGRSGPQKVHFSREELLDEYRARREELGHPLTIIEASKVYQRWSRMGYGTWQDLLEAVGDAPPTQGSPFRDEDLLRDLAQTYLLTGDWKPAPGIQAHSRETYARRFGSYEMACQKALDWLGGEP